MDKNRTATIGDLVIQKCLNITYRGVVFRLERDNYGHAKVFINWADPPPEYYEEYGYSQANIHNLRSSFDVVKA